MAVSSFKYIMCQIFFCITFVLISLFIWYKYNIIYEIFQASNNNSNNAIINNKQKITFAVWEPYIYFIFFFCIFIIAAIVSSCENFNRQYLGFWDTAWWHTDRQIDVQWSLSNMIPFFALGTKLPKWPL